LPLLGLAVCCERAGEVDEALQLLDREHAGLRASQSPLGGLADAGVKSKPAAKAPAEPAPAQARASNAAMAKR